MDTIIIVKDSITKRRIEGAYVKISPEVGEAEERYTDENGEANFGELWAGLYTISVGQRNYKSGKATVELPDVVEISLVPAWAIGLGIVTGTCVVLVAATKVARWW
ncbi:MAG: hypothetical protein HWN68_20330 [Desulfobacterales bacterium]|nr:hypothetical protein [Desulfobacterales bacterium]